MNWPVPLIVHEPDQNQTTHFMDFGSDRLCPLLQPPDERVGVLFTSGHTQLCRIFGISQCNDLHRCVTQQMATPDVSPFTCPCSSPAPLSCPPPPHWAAYLYTKVSSAVLLY